jgi:hypothetical protein
VKKASFVRSAVFDVLNALAVVAAFGGAVWAERVLTFWVCAIGGLALITGLGVLVSKSNDLASKNYKVMAHGEARTYYELWTGVGFALSYAALGWSWLAALQFFATIFYCAGVVKIREAQETVPEPPK